MFVILLIPMLNSTTIFPPNIITLVIIATSTMTDSMSSYYCIVSFSPRLKYMFYIEYEFKNTLFPGFSISIVVVNP